MDYSDFPGCQKCGNRPPAARRGKYPVGGTTHGEPTLQAWFTRAFGQVCGPRAMTVACKIDSFDYYEPGLVSNFSGRETWVYTTPHNIQRFTPQVESCANCHGNPDIFLTADKIAPGELEANQDVIVDVIPSLP